VKTCHRRRLATAQISISTEELDTPRNAALVAHAGCFLIILSNQPSLTKGPKVVTEAAKLILFANAGEQLLPDWPYQLRSTFSNQFS